MVEGLFQFRRDVARGAGPDPVPAHRLRPETEGALGRAAPGGVEGDIGVLDEGDVVFPEIEIPSVDVHGKRQGVQVLQERAVGIVDDPVPLAVADPGYFRPRLPPGEFGHGMVELLPDDKVDGGPGPEALLRQDRHMGADHGDLQRRVGGLHELRHPDIVGESRGAGKNYDKGEVGGDTHSLLGGNAVGRGIDQAAVLDQAGRVSEPGRIPEGGYLPGGLIPGAGAAVKTGERGGIE